jgi:putative two-component system response regulator
VKEFDMTQGKILAVDDTPASLRLLTDLLKTEGYDVRSAISGELALHAAASELPDLILLDIRMPAMDGYEVCRRLKANPETRDVPVIFVSAAVEMSEKLKGFEIGAVDYVTKPYQREELLARVRTHLELNSLRNHLEELVDVRTAELKISDEKLLKNLFDSVSALASIVEMRDPYTAGHQRRVAHLAVAIAKEMQLPERQIEGIRLAGVVHDVGKIQVPAEILSKPGKLNALEFGLIKDHSLSGYEILKNIDFPWPIAQIVLQHHERLDGSGYPRGLKGDEILIEAKIMAVADVVESMMSHRPYRPSLGIDAALEEVVRNKGRQFDPVIAEVCIKLFREKDYAIPI